MAIALRSSGIAYVGGSTTQSIAAGSTSSMAAGDVLVVFGFAFNPGVTVTPPAGWTQFATGYSQTSTNISITPFAKVLVSGDVGATITFTGSAAGFGAEWMDFTGVDGTHPINASNAAGDSNTSPTIPAITTTVANTVLVAFAADNGSGTMTTTGYTTVNPGTGSSCGYSAPVASGAQATQAWSDSAGGQGSAAAVVALVPSGASGSLGDATQSTASASPTSVAADGASTSVVTITVKTSGSVALASKSVKLAGTGTTSHITSINGVALPASILASTGTYGTTNGSGVVTFNVSDGTVQAVTYTATDSTDGVTITQTAGVSFTSPPAPAAADLGNGKTPVDLTSRRSVVATAATVGTSAVALPLNALRYRNSILVFNNAAGGGNTLYLGGSAVTTSTGIPVPPQQSVTLTLGPTNQLYGIASGVSTDVRVLESS